MSLVFAPLRCLIRKRPFCADCFRKRTDRTRPRTRNSESGWRGRLRAEIDGQCLPNLSPWSWSPDGTELAGDAQLPDRPSGPLVVYSLATGRFTRLYESGSSRSPLWLNDGRRLLFLEESKVMLIDRVSHATRELMSVAPDSLDGRWSITRDNRTIFLERHIEQADIWLMRLK